MTMEEWSEKCNVPGFEFGQRQPQAKEHIQPLEAEKDNSQNKIINLCYFRIS